jgi:hypothetical protein
VAELRSDELNKTYCRNPEDQKSQTAKLWKPFLLYQRE